MSDAINHPQHYGGDVPTEPIVDGKICSSCLKTKQLDGFPPDKRTKDGRAAKCYTCAVEIKRLFDEANPGLVEARKERKRASERESYIRNKPLHAERMRWYKTKVRYGVDRERYYKMLHDQSGKCKICMSVDPGRKDGYFSIDHDHDTKVVRGLLCHPCNVAIGMFKESPEIMRAGAIYIEEALNG